MDGGGATLLRPWQLERLKKKGKNKLGRAFVLRGLGDSWVSEIVRMYEGTQVENGVSSSRLRPGNSSSEGGERRTLQTHYMVTRTKRIAKQAGVQTPFTCEGVRRINLGWWNKTSRRIMGKPDLVSRQSVLAKSLRGGCGRGFKTTRTPQRKAVV